LKVTVVDSGLGGIAFSRSVNLDIKYLNINLLIDKDGFPYGDKDLLWLKERLINLVEMAKTNIVIIACNTLSSLIFYYDLKFKKTVVDVITPTIYFLQSKKSKKITILATQNTIKMDIYRRLLDCEIVYIDATKLISDLENKDNYNDSLYKILNKIDANSELIILGCTHLISIKEEFRKRIMIDILSQDELFISLFK
jgi:glutamate racemase